MATDYKDIMNHLPQGPGSRLNSDTVDGIQTSPAHSPRPNTLVPLDSTGKLPTGVLPNSGTWALVSTTTVTSSTFTASSLTANTWYEIVYDGVRGSSAYPFIRFNSDTGTNYYGGWRYNNGSTSYSGAVSGGTSLPLGDTANTFAGAFAGRIRFKTGVQGNANAATVQTQFLCQNASGNTYMGEGTSGGLYNGSAAITSVTIGVSSGSWTGTASLYKEGVAVVTGATGATGPQGDIGPQGPSGDGANILAAMLFGS